MRVLALTGLLIIKSTRSPFGECCVINICKNIAGKYKCIKICVAYETPTKSGRISNFQEGEINVRTVTYSRREDVLKTFEARRILPAMSSSNERERAAVPRRECTPQILVSGSPSFPIWRIYRVDVRSFVISLSAVISRLLFLSAL